MSSNFIKASTNKFSNQLKYDLTISVIYHFLWKCNLKKYLLPTSYLFINKFSHGSKSPLSVLRNTGNIYFNINLHVPSLYFSTVISLSLKIQQVSSSHISSFTYKQIFKVRTVKWLRFRQLAHYDDAAVSTPI